MRQPMAIRGMISFNTFCHAFTHGQSFFRHERTIDLIFICTIESYMGLLPSVRQFLEGSLITSPTFPVKKLSCITIKSFPDPEFSGFFEIMPHFVHFKNHCFVCQ